MMRLRFRKKETLDQGMYDVGPETWSSDRSEWANDVLKLIARTGYENDELTLKIEHALLELDNAIKKQNEAVKHLEHDLRSSGFVKHHGKHVAMIHRAQNKMREAHKKILEVDAKRKELMSMTIARIPSWKSKE